MTTFNGWTLEQLTRQSWQRANGYCPGTMNPPSSQQHDATGWTASRLSGYSANLARGYGL